MRSSIDHPNPTEFLAAILMRCGILLAVYNLIKEKYGIMQERVGYAMDLEKSVTRSIRPLGSLRVVVLPWT
jgi:hypothetical protein